MDRQEQLERLCQENALLVVYLFGSRADDGLRLLRGDTVAKEGSDLDVGIVFRDPAFDPRLLATLQIEMENLFEPLRVDLVPLQRVDVLFQFNAIEGHRIMTTNSTAADFYELQVMRQAAELLPVQRWIEQEVFGFSTT